jgi:SAM-dependent methyltransferase
MCGAPVAQARVLGKRLNASQGIRPTKKIGITTTIVQCKRCLLNYSNPQPVPLSIAQHYGTPPESYWKPAYFELNPNYFKKQIDTFFQLHPGGDALRALDVGAGIGKAMIALNNRGLDAYGFEPSEPFYRRAIEKMNISPEKLQLCSVEEAQYPEAHFDLITFGASLEHLYDPSAAICKMLPWLRPGGLIHIEVPSSAWLTGKIMNLAYRLQGLDYVGNLSPMHPPFHLHEFDLKSFQAHAHRHNYKIAYHKFMVASTYLPKVLNPVVKPLMAKTNTGMQLEIWLRKP